MKQFCTATALFFAPFIVSANEISVYGKANVSLQLADEGAGNFTDIKSNASRIGIKGDYKLDDNLTVVYKYEVQVDLADEAEEDNLKSRNQYVGLQGSFGELLLGRNDTVLKQIQGSVDLFNDYQGDLKYIWKGENRIGNSLTYKTAKFNQFQFGITYVTEGASSGKDGVSAALSYGDQKLKKTDFYAAIALDNDVKGYDVARVIGQFNVSGVKVGLGWQTQEAVASGVKSDGYLANVAYSLDKTTFKAQYQTLENNNVSSLGVDYKLGENTKLFGWYTNYDHDVAVDHDYLAIGIEHKF